MVNRVIPVQEKKKKANLTPCIEALKIFLSEGSWAKQKLKSQSSKIGFRRGRAKDLVRSGFKEKILRNEAMVRQKTKHLA